MIAYLYVVYIAERDPFLSPHVFDNELLILSRLSKVTKPTIPAIAVCTEIDPSIYAL